MPPSMPTSREQLLEGWIGSLRGQPLTEVPTPALIVDHDALDRNLRKMAELAVGLGVRLRVHSKTHKSVDIAKLQIALGACGVCCQKVSEAEALVEAGIGDVLISNQVVDERKLRKVAELAGRARVLLCVDDLGNVSDISAAAVAAGSVVECLVEVDVGSGRCGVAPGESVLELARVIDTAPNLRFAGIQAYHGAAQHVRDFANRRAMIARASAIAAEAVALLERNGLECEIVGGAGTGTFRLEGASGVYKELQCGSYVFMDADYQAVLDEDGEPLDDFENSLFVWTQVMSKTRTGMAVCDAGLKAHSVDAGLPAVFGRTDLKVTKCSDEHAVISDLKDTLALGEKLKLVPGHCDPTCNLYDCYIVVKDERVIDIWPVSARGLLF